MKKIALAITSCLFAGSSFAQALNCASLANSAGAEPAGYAAQCLASVSASPSVSPAAVNAPTSIGTTLDIRGGTAPRVANVFYSFVLNNFPVQTAFGPAGQASIFALDYNSTNTTLFAVTGSGAVPNPSTLGTVSTTGVFTAIAPVTGLTAGDGASGLAINPRTNEALLSAAGGTPISSRLYRLNLTTGVATLIGQMTAPTDATGTIMIDISSNCAGELYAHNISDDALYQINTTTGAGTARPTHGLAANFAQGMDFDNDSGTLYAFIYTGAGTNRFGTFNLATGAFTALATDNPLGEYEGAIPTACPANATITPVTPAGALVANSPSGSNTGSVSLGFRNTGTGPGDVVCTATGTGVAVTPASFSVGAGATVNTLVTLTGNPGATISGTVTCSNAPAGPVIATYTVSGLISPVTQLPTLSVFGMAAMGLMLVGLGFAATRRFS